MAYFLPSSFQKRILRYALSRLEILDTDRLDLDNLDIAWGRTSTIELKDVGIRLDKLTSLLSVPKHLQVTKALISVLKLTIPADLYGASIAVDVQGVDIGIRVQERVGHNASGFNKKEGHKTHGVTGSNPTSGIPGTGESRVHDPGGSERAGAPGSEESLQDGTTFPTTDELARSYLQAEPPTKRTELESAVVQSQLLGESKFSEGTGMDDSQLGVGSPLSLPGFLAAFLKGVGDRLKISVKGVTVDLDLTVDAASAPTTEGDSSQKPLDVSLRLVLNHIAIDEVDKKDGAVDPSDARSNPKAIRRITLDGLNLLVLSEVASPLNTARTKSASSPATSTPPGAAWHSNRISDPASSSVDDSDRLTATMSQSIADLRSVPNRDSYFLNSEDVTMENDWKSPPTSQAAGSHDVSAEVTDSASSEVFYSALNDNVSGRRDGQQLETQREFRSVTGMTNQDDDDDLFHDQDDCTSPAASEDLQESRIFSHEEATSMYLSAMSDDRQDARNDPQIPGAWGSSTTHHLAANSSQEIQPTFSKEIEAPTSINTVHAGNPEPHVEPAGIHLPGHSVEDEAEATTNSPPESTMFTADGSPSEEEYRSQPSDSFSARQIPSSEGDFESLHPGWRKIAEIHKICIEIPSVQQQEDSLLVTGAGSNASESQREPPTSGNPSMPPNTVTVRLDYIHVMTDLDLIRLSLCIWSFYNGLSYSNPVSHKEKKSAKQYGEFSFNLIIETLHWQLLDHVRRQGEATSPVRVSGSSRVPGPTGPDVLFESKVQNINVRHWQSADEATIDGSVAKFTFGYADENILSFDSRLKLRDSTRDILAPVHNDVSFHASQSKSMTKLDISTLPVRLTLDLRKLDETFAWFGGLSSFLGLGSSIASHATYVEHKTKKSDSSKKPKGVRFQDTKDNDSPSRVQDLETKFTARIGGLVLDIQGTTCAAKVESTAVKIVNRMDIFALQVDRLSFKGPYATSKGSQNHHSLHLRNVRLEYLATPKDIDLDRLLALLSPTPERMERDNGILLETLLRQREKGSVLRATAENLELECLSIDNLHLFISLAEELKKLSTVAKYLPEDDRPGLLILGLVRSVNASIKLNPKFGYCVFESTSVELAHVTFPTLVCLNVSSISIARNEEQKIMGRVLPVDDDSTAHAPVLAARFIGNEMEPKITIDLRDVQVDYHVDVLESALGLQDELQVDVLAADLASSMATLTDAKSTPLSSPQRSRGSPSITRTPSSHSRPFGIELHLNDFTIGLNPKDSKAKGLVVLTEAHLSATVPEGEQMNATFDVKRASLMVIDNQDELLRSPGSHPQLLDHQVASLENAGYVVISRISAAQVKVKIVKHSHSPEPSIEVDVRDDLFVLESCADSTQTLGQVFSGLTPKLPKKQVPKYRTEIVPVQDMLASFTGDAFALSTADPSVYSDDDSVLDEGDIIDDDVPQNLEFVSSFYNPNPLETFEGIADSMLDDDLDSLARPPAQRHIGDKNVLESFNEQVEIEPGNAPLDFNEDHFGAVTTTSAKKNMTAEFSPQQTKTSPLKIRTKDMHLIWNLYDGYDWQRTRDAITQAIAEVEQTATEKLVRKDKTKSLTAEDEKEDVISDYLFNSIYIGIPAKSNPSELKGDINWGIDEDLGGNDSPGLAGRQSSTSRQGKRLKLNRSKHHKMTFELKGVSTDFEIYAPGSGEIESSFDLRVHDLDIFDHVPTSTWKKFATYMRDMGERELGTSMVHIEVENVRPVASLAATEIMLKASVLPLRLHVDQDALDFLSRFFDFKDDSIKDDSAKSEAPFIQRAEVKPVRVRLDFKPKRVDYAGIRSGRTNEFMNFIVLDSADMVLRHVIIYGVSGFDRLGKTLNDIWMPDIKRNQLPGVLAGLAPIRSLVNVGGGVRDLVAVPIREYRKDGRIVRSFQKGALAFAKTTTGELMRLGAKLAIGTQTVLQGAEEMLVQSPPPPSSSSSKTRGAAEGLTNWEDADDVDDDERNKKVSLYADQPIGVVQGLRGAYASLERDLLTAKDAIVAMPGEILESKNAGEAAKAVWKGAPTVILRPAMGISKAVGQTLMGATNTLDAENRRRVEDKYKKY